MTLQHKGRLQDLHAIEIHAASRDTCFRYFVSIVYDNIFAIAVLLFANELSIIVRKILFHPFSLNKD